MATKNFLVWNSTGFPQSRRDLVEGWADEHNIDIVVLIEGGQNVAYSKGGVEHALTAVSEKLAVTSIFELNETVDFESTVKSVMGSGRLKPSAGKSVNKYYAVTDSVDLLDDDEIVTYEHTAAIRTWMMEPIEAISVSESEVMKTGRKRRPTVNVSDSDKNAAKDMVQKRINMLGHRRPKAFTSDGLRVYMWHAPLGGECSPEDSTLKALAGDSCSGRDAIYYNWLFARHLGAIPRNTLVVGDLNMDATAVASIYKKNPGATSSDGWCHAIAGVGVTLTLLKAPAHDKASMGDHAPIVFQARW